MKFTYSSNNSGGNWWLTDNDWKALEAAGWKVNWIKDDSYYEGKERWLDCLAMSAVSPEVSNEEEAIYLWEKVTQQTTSDEGCNCCGPPHSSYEERDDND